MANKSKQNFLTHYKTLFLGLVSILFISRWITDSQTQNNKVEVFQDTNNASGKIDKSTGKQQNPAQVAKENQQAHQTKSPARDKADEYQSFENNGKDEEIICTGSDDDLAFIDVIRAPVFPGCEQCGNNKEKNKACMSRKIKMFVEKNFDKQVIKHLKTKPGEQVRLKVLFTVNENGQVVNIKARSKYKALENEIIRVLKKLPKLKPGLDAYKRPVSLRYSLPMVFEVN